MHQKRETRPLLVAPTTGSEFNTLSLDLAPVACLQMADILFQFDSSFVMPDAGRILAQLPALREERRNAAGLPPISLFGHADPTGDDEYNKQLSGRRARAVFGLLTRDVATWEALFSSPFGGDNWQAKDVMGIMGAHLGAKASGMGRQQLISAYMAAICPFQLQKGDFLAGGADAKGKGDFQGCSEFNPLVILSQSELQKFTKPQRDHENQPNRRVVIFLFRPGSKVSAADWPCPRFDEVSAGCRKRFFVNPPGDQRRASGAERKQFEETKDTFACRFYDRIARLSPCEKVLKRDCCKHRGVVVDNLDPLQMGRLKVQAPDVLGELAVFAMPAVPYAGPGVGFLLTPPVGANVWVDFENGDLETPVWSGCFWNPGEMPAEAGPDTKVLQTEKVQLKLSDKPAVGGFVVEVSGSRLELSGSSIRLSVGSASIEVGLGQVSFNDGALEVS